ncbi:uncharacterized protein LOC120183826 [Hibiscus syriacus]|uniref:uncharacterized protein LOC120183826 n=1 Tax=Hibiscus syriacus TaxID=106335 RepID=UPI0019209E95|nr:uncharacterized protein LOC120183826 [Hibiscus syriacus]
MWMVDSGDERQMIDFRSVIADCGLTDVGFEGQCFTWERGRSAGTNIHERLDIVLASDSWRNMFGDLSLQHLPYSISDHCLLLLDTDRKGKSERRCAAEVERLWVASEGLVPERLSQVCQGLDVWFKNICIQKRLTMSDFKHRLADLMELNISDEVLGEIVDTRLQMNLEADKHKLYCEQRARVNQLKAGDNNKNFFHIFAS